MIYGNATFEPGMKIFVTLFVLAMGFWMFIRPDQFWGVRRYFDRAARKLPVLERERLERALGAREDAQGVWNNRERWIGAVVMATAPLALVPRLSYVASYVAFSLALASVMLVRNLQSGRAERRVAPLMRRSLFSALPPGVLIALSCCFAAALMLAAYPQVRLFAVSAAFTAIAFAAIAWRFAAAPAVLLGIDPQVEYAVDERVRAVQATNIAILGCVLTSLFLETMILPKSADYASVSDVLDLARLVAIYACLAAIIQYNLLLRKPLRIA